MGNDYLYLCLFDNGTIKIGRTRSINQRITTHIGFADRFGIKMIRHESIVCSNSKKAEKDLIQWCQKNSSHVSGREWFQGILFDECFSYAKFIADKYPYENVYENIKILDLIPIQTSEFSGAFNDGIKKFEKIHPEATAMVIVFKTLHSVCEVIRTSVKNGATAPEWFDDLNFPQPFEIELFFYDTYSSDGRSLFVRACIAAGEEINKLYPSY